MINIKEQIARRLETIVPEKDVSDSFPDDFTGDTQIQYTEEENKSRDMSGNKVITSYIRYRIDIWNKRSTSALACAVDEKLNGELGLIRTGCMDANESQRKHKIMRFEGIVEEETGRITSPR
ncbi:hypothetical protein D5278_13710 [bacterium 1XD21-13]|nr:hypothetical protein [bacterium 1XD21-13]